MPCAPEPVMLIAGSGQAQNPCFNGRIAEQGRRFLLIVGNHLAVVCLQQAAGVGRFGAGNSCLTECIVQLKCFSDKGQFFCRYRQGIIVKLCQRVAVNERLCMGFLGGGMRLS